MAFMSSVTITIEFAGHGWPAQSENPPFFGLALRVVEARTDAGRTITLVQQAKPDYTLTSGEADELLRLLGQMEVKAPWEALAGFDGCTYTLVLRQAMSSMTFSWWAHVPEGWESVGAIVDYVTALANNT